MKEKGLKFKVVRLIDTVARMRNNIINLMQANGNSACELAAIKKILIDKGLATEEEILKEINSEVAEFNKYFEAAGEEEPAEEIPELEVD